MFLERVVVLVSACICLCSTAFASIVVDVNNLDDTVRYRSYKKITKWNSVDEYAVVKSVNYKNEETYFFQLWRGIRTKRLMGKTAILEIDGDKIILNSNFAHGKHPVCLDKSA